MTKMKNTDQAIKQLEKRYQPQSGRKKETVTFLTNAMTCSLSDGTLGMFIIPADCTLKGVSIGFDNFTNKLDIQMTHVGKLVTSITHTIGKLPYNIDLDYKLNRGDVLKFSAPNDVALLNVLIGLKVQL